MMMEGFDGNGWLVAALVFLLVAGFFSALSCALRATGDAGVQRLTEKRPGARGTLARWSTRWNLLLLAIRLLLGLFEILAVYCAARGSLGFAPGPLLLLALAAMALYMLCIRMIPFVLAEGYADRISLRFLPLAVGCTRLLYPLVWPIDRLESRLLHHTLKNSDELDRPSVEDEIRSAVDQAAAGGLEEEEREIIRSVFEFGDTVAREIMTPRVDMEGLQDTLTVQECVEIVRESRHSRFPVYHGKIDDVRGIVHVKDLLRRLAEGRQQEPVGSVLKKIGYVPETMPINDLLKHMQAARSQMVLVVDEYGGTSGIVCMEDIIEELVGEIEDEYDPMETGIQARPDGSWLVDAKVPLYELNEELNLNLPESDEYDSLGGYVLDVLGRIPEPKAVLEAGGVRITVASAGARQIHALRIQRIAPSDSD